ncbi:SMI1/KNR4 family protein [Paenibacillus qinlingensis]|uniref:SMI1/KNR4 family protein n=1 Tax=Paenibacillus qinlingensis TaxID=1837343 RepID=UPI0015646966|nr:SMI1/KNR4 family protein [Paenibacillus qinlingensis]NQX63648.1 SMI1/KNR4 family protein [Paenibacillus qinlingensis]
MEIHWRFKVSDVSSDEIKKLEEFLGVTFPDDYLECIRENNGAMPVPNFFEVNGREMSFGALLSINEKDVENIRMVFEALEERLPSEIIPFSIDAGGNFICFDYKNGTQSVPSIVFFDHEQGYAINDLDEDQLARKPLELWLREALEPVCNTFSELLSMLCD